MSEGEGLELGLDSPADLTVGFATEVGGAVIISIRGRVEVILRGRGEVTGRVTAIVR